MKIKLWPDLIIAIIGIWILFFGGLATLQGWIGGTGPAPSDGPILPPSKDAAQLQFSSYDFILRTAVTTATTTIDICKADPDGIFDFMTAADTLTVATTPDTSNQYFAEGDVIIMRLDCTGNPTNGLDYYQGWFITRLAKPSSILKTNESNTI